VFWRDYSVIYYRLILEAVVRPHKLGDSASTRITIGHLVTRGILFMILPCRITISLACLTALRPWKFPSFRVVTLACSRYILRYNVNTDVLARHIEPSVTYARQRKLEIEIAMKMYSGSGICRLPLVQSSTLQKLSIIGFRVARGAAPARLIAIRRAQPSVQKNSGGVR